MLFGDVIFGPALSHAPADLASRGPDCSNHLDCEIPDYEIISHISLRTGPRVLTSSPRLCHRRPGTRRGVAGRRRPRRRPHTLRSQSIKAEMLLRRAGWRATPAAASIPAAFAKSTPELLMSTAGPISAADLSNGLTGPRYVIIVSVAVVSSSVCLVVHVAVVSVPRLLIFADLIASTLSSS